MYIVGKFGGGVISSLDGLLRLPGVAKDAGCNFLVISAFGGQTRILESVCYNQDTGHFYSDFLPFHEYLAKEVGVYNNPSVFDLFDNGARRMETLVHRLRVFSDNDKKMTEAVVAEILSVGEDFSTTIVHSVLERMSPKGHKFNFIDSRELIRTKPGMFVGAEFDQFETRKAILKKVGNSRKGMTYVTQGFVCGTMINGKIKTTVMPFDGSDVTAAILSATLPKRDAEKNHKLIFFKRHSGEGQELPVPRGALGILKLFEFMKENNVTVVSRDIEDVEGLPPFFEITDYNIPTRSTLVSTESLKLSREIRSISLN